MTAVFSAERLFELDTVLGTGQRDELFAKLAAQAVEARASIRRNREAGDDRAVLRDVHRLKGAAQIVGAEDLIAALRAIEASPPGGIAQTAIDAADRHIAALIAAVATVRARR